MDVDTLLAEAEIRNVIYRYCRGMDRMDEELVRSCYHDGAVDHHGNFEGSVDEYIPWAFGLVQRYTVTMHFTGNVLVELSPEDSNVARVETYCMAVHRREGGQPHHNVIAGFRYVDRFAHRAPAPDQAPEWRIERRAVISEWLRTDPPEGWWPITEVFETGRRDRTDAIYRVLDG